MGHLLIPVAAGLVEMRWVAKTNQTGERESTWILRSNRRPTADGSFDHPSQAAFDDPALDPQFPQHPLSIARAAGRWFVKHARVRVVRPTAHVHGAEILLPSLGCALVPPPRFKLAAVEKHESGEPRAMMNRASLSGTDGVDWFWVTVLPAKKRSARNGQTLSAELATYAREVFIDQGIESIRTEIVATSTTGEARVFAEGDGHLGRIGMGLVGTEFLGGSLALLGLSVSVPLPNEEFFTEVTGAARTLRSLRKA